MNDGGGRRTVASAYDAAGVEAKWQARWQAAGCFKATSGTGDKFFNFDGGPFPNGPLHMGHVRTFTLGDVMARYQRMRGRRVLYCFEFDAFGLPNELAAEALAITPETFTRLNIAHMREQMVRLGLSYDWDHVTTTCDPHYYHWTQWLFLKLYERGLVYRSEADLNWCPSCKTTLAHMQVKDGGCWRCETPVELRRLTQWFVALSHYSAALSDSLDQVEGMSSRVRNVLHGFIGKTLGIEVDFQLVDRPGASLTAFLRSELAGAAPAYLGIAPTHPVLATVFPERADALTRALRQPGRERRRDGTARSPLDGADTGLRALDPKSGTSLPIFVARYVDPFFATGVEVGCPDADPRDRAFATRHAIAHASGGAPLSGRPTTHYRVRDWLVSRQRGWGTPIPIVYCGACGVVPEPRLPVRLPLAASLPGKGLAAVAEFAQTTCPRCGRPARRETDTLDCYFDVIWCFLACASGLPSNFAFRSEDFAEWMPVDFFHNGLDSFFYIHLYRFIGHVLHEMGILPEPEPMRCYVGHDAVLLDGRKMSKHHGNVVAPDEVLARVGADVLRVHVLWAANPLKSLEWSDQALHKAQRLLADVRRLSLDAAALVRGCADGSAVNRTGRPSPLERSAAHAARRVTEFIERYQYSGCLQEIQGLVQRMRVGLDRLQAQPNDVAFKETFAAALSCLIRMMAPLAPHLAEELWEETGGSGLVAQAPWPEDSKKAP